MIKTKKIRNKFALSIIGYIVKLEINLLNYFTPKRFANAIKIITSYQLSRILRKPIVWGFPMSFSIEPTNRCNLNCPECPSGLGELTRPLGLLSFEKFKIWIDQIKEHAFYVQLYFQGEPFINKDLPQMLNYARKQNVYTSISTNGLLLNEKNINEILENPPDKLIFSIDGLDEETYQNYRVGGTFSNVDRAFRMFMKEKRKRKNNKPFVEFQFIVMKQNEHQIEDVKRYAEELGVDKVALKTMQVSSYESALHFLPKNQKYSRYKIENGTFRLKKKLANRCFALWRTSVITWDGVVVPCCFDKDADFKLGNIEHNNFDEIWTNNNYKNFRKKILEDRASIPMCRNCTEGLKINIFDD